MMYVRGVYNKSINLSPLKRARDGRDRYIYIVVWSDVSCCTRQGFVCLFVGGAVSPLSAANLHLLVDIFWRGDVVGEKGIKGDGVSVFWFLSCIFSSFKNTQLGKLLYRSMVSVDSVCMYIFMRTMLQFSK